LGPTLPKSLPRQAADIKIDEELLGDNFDEIEVYQTVFEVFDKDRCGFIEPNDLHEIAVSLNKDP